MDLVENQIDLRNGWVDSLLQLSQRNRNMWDSTNAELADALPTTMNSEERNNILEVRNADLINMFEVYPSFEASLKEQIMAAGLQDKKDAMMISKLMHQIDSIEKVIGKNIEMISQKDPALGKRLLDTLNLANTLNH